MSNLGRALAFGSILLVGACGPAARNTGGDDDGTTDAHPSGTDSSPATCTLTGPENTPAACSDGIDNDCDGNFDCGDPDCSGIGDCPVCGQVQVPMATPLALPDGQDSGTTCSTDAQCVGKTDADGDPTPNCIIAGDMPGGGVGEDYEKGCHASYTDTLHFIGFPDGATLTDTSKLLKVCAKMEHSWVRDINIELIAPNGAKIQLLAWQNRSTFEEIFMGEPYEDDETGAPKPGVGYEYCWVPTGGLGHMTISPRAPLTPSSAIDGTLPAGDYTTDTPFTALMGTPLNGDWEFRVTDLWEVDNGFLFDWSISFDPSLVASCTGPIIQ